MSVVRAVPDEEGACALGCQHAVGLLASDGAPVEATLLELVKRGQDHLVLRLGGESLVTVRQPHVGVQGAAAHCGVAQLAVSYHGAVHALWAVWGALSATQTRAGGVKRSLGVSKKRSAVGVFGNETP